MTRSIVKVICVVDYYLPGFKGGGPIRTIANLRRQLSESVEIAIFTRDRDLGSGSRYKGIHPDNWINAEDGPIYYASPSEFSAAGLKRAIGRRRFDILYLNSFFGFRSSIQMYFRFRRSVPNMPILLAPRGEFSAGALSLKRLKKLVFLKLCKALGLYRDINWHASTEEERDDIVHQFPTAANRIQVAKDPVDIGVAIDGADRPSPSPSGQLRLAFISRISPMKNLDGLLRILATVTHRTELDIFGPIEDPGHWRHCQELIDALPSCVTAAYKGALEPDAVSPVFAEYDLFALPSHGENFGHVIFEALRAGTPVLLSNHTHWKADPAGAVSVVPLVNKGDWTTYLSAAAARSIEEKLLLRKASRAYAEEIAKNSDVVSENLSMFLTLAPHANRELLYKTQQQSDV